MADAYEGFDAVPFADLDDAEIEHYCEANVAACATWPERAQPDVALANHLVMGPAILARAIGGRVPYAVKVHGSALEYTVRPTASASSPYAREGLGRRGGGAGGLAPHGGEPVGGDGRPRAPARTRLGPPGVDVRDVPAPGRRRGRRGPRGARGPPGGRRGGRWGGEPGAAGARARSTRRGTAIVTYVGKLIVSKGVDLLLAAWPLVVAAVPEARLCVVGFGTYRDGLDATRRGARRPPTSTPCARSPAAAGSWRAARAAS